MLDPLILSLVTALADEPPAPEDVKAGPIGFAVFVFLILAVALIGWSLVRQLRKAQAAKDAGVYGDEPAAPAETSEPDGPEGPEGPAR